MANFPGAVPSYTATAGADFLGNTSIVGLSGLLNAFEIDITGLATKLGTGASTPASNTFLVGTGSGTSAWQSLTSAQLAARVSDETGSGSLVFASSPTLTTPTIADFTNANHDHGDTDDGGQLVGSTALTNSSVTSDKLATGAATSTVATSETTASTSYVDLATAGPSVTVTIGVNGLCLIGFKASVSNSLANDLVSVSFVASGTNTIAIGTQPYEIQYQAYANGAVGWPSATFLLTGLSIGLTTFKLQYKAVVGGTATILNRNIWALPL